METIETNDDQAQALPDDFAAYQAARDAQETGAPIETSPAANEKEPTPPSEPAASETEEASQTATESETAEEAEQEEGKTEETEETQEEAAEEEHPEKDTRLSRRMRKLTGTIAKLEARLEALQNGQADDDETEEEAASSPEPAAEVASSEEKLVRPKLSDFEDVEGGASAWDQYEEALDAYNDKKQERGIRKALADQKAKLEQEHAQTTAQADWNKAASRFTDYNEVVNDTVKISSAMEAVMRMDPENGTALAYYLGKHPEESLRIAQETLAQNEKQWSGALARAGMELGRITAMLDVEGKPAAAAPKAAAPAPPVKSPAAPAGAKPPAPAPKPQLKKISSASRPPAQIRGGGAKPSVDVNSDEDARDYAKWEKARNAQLQRK